MLKNPVNLASLLSETTGHPAKRSIYEHDPDLETGYSLLVDELGDAVLSWLWAHGLVILKPETLFEGRSNAALDVLHAAGFQVAAMAEMTFSSQQVEALRRYNLEIAALHHGIAYVLQMTAGPSVVMLVRPTAVSNARMPASALMNEFKAKRDDGIRTFRGELEPFDPVVNYVHVSDDPADVVRELGVLGEEIARSLIRGSRRSLGKATPARFLQAAENRVRRGSLISFHSALKRIQEVVDERECERGPNSHLQQIRLFCHLAWGGLKLNPRSLVRLLQAEDLESSIDPFTLTIIASTLAAGVRGIRPHPVGPTPPDFWDEVTAPQPFALE